MTSLLMCCKTQQSSEQKSTVIATDTAIIARVTANDSTTTKAKIDSIIIEEYTQSAKGITECVRQKKQGSKICPWQKRNDISKNDVRTPTKKVKMYGVNISNTWSANKDSINKQTAHQEKTVSQVKQKTPIKNNAGGKIVYILIAIIVILFAGYLYWKNAVQ